MEQRTKNQDFHNPHMETLTDLLNRPAQQPTTNNQLMKKFLNAFHYAWKGLHYTFRTQINFRVEILAALFIIALSCYLNLNNSEWLWIFAAIALVLITELVNTAIETLVNLVSPDFNPKAGIVKDISAAVVLISALFALTVSILILLPKILHVT